MRRALAALAFLLLATATAAEERILSWRSDIAVLPDSTLEVTETLLVRAEGDQIRRGILRDFPTTYVDRRGMRVVTGFDVIEVMRDGRPEPHRTERLANGIRVRIGEPEVYLAPGEYTYAIRYRTDRQLGFFPDHDELYWNVTGNGWDFPIDSAAAVVRLPGNVPADAIRAEAYTGPQGAQGLDWQASTDAGMASFQTTRGLGPREGFTIVASWPKGVVSAPGTGERVRYALRDAWPALLAAMGLLLLVAYYIRAWVAVGRDPPGRIVVPRYDAPQGQSPASMRYLRRMAYDDRCFAAAVLSLAVQGGLTIEQEKTGLLGRKRTYTLHSSRPASGGAAFSEDEARLHGQLFASSTSVELDDKNQVLLNAVKLGHMKQLRKQFTPSLFRINGGWHGGGVVLTLLIGGGLIWLANRAGFAPTWWFATKPGWIAIGAGVATLLTNLAFGRLLKAPTIAGRAVMDHIEGFRLYLDVAEGDELKLIDEPPLTTELFERYLPAALALEVEQHWAERFSEVFATQAATHSPNWYRGDSWSTRDVARFSSGLGSSFSSAIASASTAPGSSSGGGGGGSSGGGGGGGGGGG
ncbi:MAG: DUF2207 domain-containing protein, partial [Steroidobacteraceae bacterium]|nr:DUF2207 domain-containing protein [Steroidobacteraceae bacterium]